MPSRFQCGSPSGFRSVPLVLAGLLSLIPCAGLAQAPGTPSPATMANVHFYEPAFVAKVQAGDVDARDIWQHQPNALHFSKLLTVEVTRPDHVGQYYFTVEGSGPSYTLHLKTPSWGRGQESEEGPDEATFTWISATRIRTNLHSKNLATQEELERLDMSRQQIIQEYDRRYSAKVKPSLVGSYRSGTLLVSFALDGRVTINRGTSKTEVVECETPGEHVRAPCIQLDALPGEDHPAYRVEQRDGRAVLLEGTIPQFQSDYRTFERTNGGSILVKQ